MRNNSIYKKAVASVIAALVASMGFTSSLALSQQFDETRSSVAYCSQPLKIPVGGTYDYRFFVYASKAGSGALNMNIEKGYAIALENLYPGSKAQLDVNTITVSDSTAFILHNLEGGKIGLSGTDIQFAPSEKCDELVASMTAINGYAKQKLVEDEDLVGAQMELVRAMTAATAAIAVKDVIGYEPTPGVSVTPATPYQYSAEEIVKYLDDNGYRGGKFLDFYNSFLANEETKFYEIAGKTQTQKEIFLKIQYNKELLEKLEMLSEEQRNILKKISVSFDYNTVELSDAETKQVLEILTKEKIFKHSSDSSRWLSLTEYLDKADAGLGVEYKIVSQIPKRELLDAAAKYNLEGYRIYAPSEESIHLQIFKKGVKDPIGEIPIFADKSMGNGLGEVLYGNTPSERILILNLNRNRFSLQGISMSLFHEISHEATLALKSFSKLWFGNTPNRGTEGLAEFDKYKFALEQHKSNLPGYEFAVLENKNFKLKGVANIRIYIDSENIFEFIKDKIGGQNTIDNMKKGDASIETLVDINGLDSIFKAQFLTPVLDEINAQADRFSAVAKKYNDITNGFLTDIENPDITKINTEINGLDALRTDFEKNPVGGSFENRRFTNYLSDLEYSLEQYRDAPKEQKVVRFEQFQKTGIDGRESLLNFISEKAAANARMYGGITKDNVPNEEFAALEDAANRVLEKIKNIRELGNNVLSEKSLQSLNSAENSMLKNKVPEELTKTAEVAKNSASGATAIAAGTAMVFALGPKFVEYGQDNNNPYLVATGETIEYSGTGLLVASAGATVAQFVAKFIGVGLPRMVSGLALTAEGFLSGTVIGLLAVAFIEMAWCAINPFGPLCFSYVQPTLALSKTKGFRGDKITYEVTGFEVQNGIGNQEGKRYLLWASQMQLGSGCVVSGGKCGGEFSVPAMSSSSMEVFAQDMNNEFRSAAATLRKMESRLTIGATVVTDGGYLCTYSGEWKGETELAMICAQP